MPEEPKEEKKSDTNISPAPAEVGASPQESGDKPGGKKPDAKPAPSGGPQPDPLSDGTVPTVLNTGSVHRSVAKGKASLTTIYRRADVLTTLLTFGGAVVAAAIILGVYAIFNRNTAKNNVPKLPSQVSNLNASQLSKLNDFFGGNSAGSSSEVLTVNSSSLFEGRVAVNSDLKVVGGEDVSGTSSLTNLSVSSTSTLGVTGVRGQLTVAGPTTLQGAVVLSNGLTVTGNVTASGNGSFGGQIAAGTINAVTLNITSGFNISSHINTNGTAPSISSGTIGGNDSAGEIASSADETTITFHQAFSKLPVIMATPTSQCPGTGQYWISATGGTGFILNNPAHCPSFDYWVVQ
jgi:hypothetical protein